jgi:polysaccharide deacetylase family protein (PEP-CTERM system associated)
VDPKTTIHEPPEERSDSAFDSEERHAAARFMQAIPNVFSVDVEEYFQVSAFENLYPRDRWVAIPSRLERGLDTVLGVASAAGVKGSFFILGWIARHHPQLVRRIAAEGHELGCHSLEHRAVFSMNRESFRQDLREARAAIQDASQAPCLLYRAPSFSVTRASLWALRILAEEGIVTDSSIYPVWHDRYGLPGAPRTPFRPLRDHPEFVEFPPSTVRWLGMTLPCAGGGYLRLSPGGITRAAIRRIRTEDRHPALVYVHPWEFDPDQPVASAPWLALARHRVGLGTNAKKLGRLFSTFRFASITDCVSALGGPAALPLVELDRED